MVKTIKADMHLFSSPFLKQCVLDFKVESEN